jgi:hypothetical protein
MRYLTPARECPIKSLTNLAKNINEQLEPVLLELLKEHLASWERTETKCLEDLPEGASLVNRLACYSGCYAVIFRALKTKQGRFVDLLTLAGKAYRVRADRFASRVTVSLALPPLTDQQMLLL